MEIKRVEEHIVIDNKRPTGVAQLTPRQEIKNKFSTQNSKQIQSVRNSPRLEHLNKDGSVIEKAPNDQKISFMPAGTIFSDIQNYSLAEALDNFKRIKKGFKVLEALEIKLDSLENSVKTIKLERHNKLVEPTLDNVFERSTAYKEMTGNMKKHIDDKMDAKECIKKLKEK